MYLAIASNDGVYLAGRTGGVRGFVIFELAGRKIRRAGWRDNPIARDSDRSACGCLRCETSGHYDGCRQYEALIAALRDVQAVVLHHPGAQLVVQLADAGIAPYVTGGATVLEAALDFNGGRLRMPADGAICPHTAAPL